ncbi:sigma-54 interaction domain-containing protein [Tepidiphilus olei]|uniref:sigma-54 interaction domain-containing protein n=1 Tax=Tepidiphilus olei TaxID=2502184 RepID=UPI0021B0F176|nr:sigma-54-dependent Fis family transcriptional regulator [Tepidiphilus olei]
MPLPTELLQLLDALPEPRIVVDTAYRILAANAAYRREFGQDPSVIGQTCYQVSHHFDRPCDQCGESCPRQQAWRSGRASRVIHRHHTPRGEEFVEVELFPLRDAGGNTTLFVETMRFLGGKCLPTPVLGMVGRSPSFLQMLELLERAGPSNTPVLLLGESGTGKELAAQALHQLSPRRDRPFVPVDCSGLPETLFESELFGHEKGAFTGATQRKTGLAEVADGGTLFLDEIGDLPLTQQVKLLRLLETGTYRRVGGVETLRSDFRLVAATHRDLQRMVEEGTFRRDLYYRISAFPVRLPPLRERREDLPLLVDYLFKRLAPQRTVHLSPEAMSRLMEHDFPGNVRELRNLLERALLLTDGDTIEARHLVENSEQRSPSGRTSEEEIVPLDEVERRYLRRALERLGGDKKALAARLGISERTLYRKLR